MQCAASASGRVILKEPRNDLASPVLELATTTASRMFSPGRNQSITTVFDFNATVRVTAAGQHYKERAGFRQTGDNQPLWIAMSRGYWRNPYVETWHGH